MRVLWTTQNEATDANGFLLESEASFVAELEVLASMGCPDTDRAKLIAVEVVGRTESVTTAEVSDAMWRSHGRRRFRIRRVREPNDSRAQFGNQRERALPGRRRRE